MSRAKERSRLFSPTVLVFAAAAILGFIAFEARGTLFGSAPVPSASSVEPVNAPPPEPSADVVTELDDIDASDEEDDEEDDEEEAGAPDASRPPAVRPRPVAHPAAKKPPPRRPGAPRKTKKKRWHW